MYSDKENRSAEEQNFPDYRQEVDLKKRKIFSLSFLFLPLSALTISEKRKNLLVDEKEKFRDHKSSNSSNFSDFLSFILGENISDEEARNLLISIKELRKKIAYEYEYKLLNSLPLENFLYFVSGLPRSIFDFWFPFAKKVKKNFLIFSENPFVFFFLF